MAKQNDDTMLSQFKRGIKIIIVYEIEGKERREWERQGHVDILLFSLSLSLFIFDRGWKANKSIFFFYR